MVWGQLGPEVRVRINRGSGVSCSGTLLRNLIRASIRDEYSGLMKITTHLDHVSHCEAEFCTNRSNRWTYRVSIINTHRGQFPRDLEGCLQGE